MNEVEKMRCGEFADMSVPELQESFEHAKKLLARLRGMSTYDEGYRELLEELVPGMPATSIICPPFHCDHGHGIRLGEHVFVNANCTFLDGAYITVGAHTLIGPDVKIYTPHHPMDFVDRRGTKEYAYPVTIGEDCWIGGGAIICPGVTIGNRCVIGAGSVVTKDVESDSVAVGNPAKVIKKQVSIRQTKISDLETVMPIFDYARQRMRNSGNKTQWVNGYPSKDIIIKDIKNSNSYVIESEKGIIGIFTFIIGEDPNYSEIVGEWPDSNPYGTIHRIASAPGAKGIADIALDFCKKAGVNIRIDTHSDNAPMLGWIAKRGFKYCGIIRVEDGTPRKAFQLLPQRGSFLIPVMETIRISRYQSPVGEMILGSYGNKLCMCDWAVEKRRGIIDRRICRYFDAEYEEGTSKVIDKAIVELDEYFAGLRKEFTVPVQFAGSKFQCGVWEELMKIPYGVTISYAELAKRINNPKAVRAVASANATNPISIFVPCHRVIGSDHKLTGYGGGLEAKQALLALEARIAGTSLPL